jgi:hypothetical protein
MFRELMNLPSVSVGTPLRNVPVASAMSPLLNAVRPDREQTIWLFAVIAGALLLGIVLRILAKKHTALRRRFVQTSELRTCLLAALLLSSWPGLPSLTSEAVACAVLILLSLSLTVGYDGTLLGWARTAGLVVFTGTYLSLSISSYYNPNSRLADFFHSYQFQLTSLAAVLYFMAGPIIANHDAWLDRHIETLRKHADTLRSLLEWKAKSTNYPVPADSAQTMLVVSIEKVRPDLETRVREGKEIARHIRAYSSYDDDGIKAEHWYWHTRGLLERWFSRTDVVQEFIASRGNEFSSYRETGYRNWQRAEQVLENQIACLEGILRRLDVYDLPAPAQEQPPEDAEPAKAKEPAPSYITYRFTGPVGQLIAGQGQTVKNINSHIAAVVGMGQEALGEAFLKLSEATLNDPQLDDSSRAQILASIEDLADAAEAPSDERKHGRIRGAIEMIGQVAAVGTQLGEVWNQWGPLITQHLRLP